MLSRDISAPVNIPEELLEEYTCNRRIPVSEKYYNEFYGDRNYFWPVSAIENFDNIYTVDNFKKGHVQGPAGNDRAKEIINLAEEYKMYRKSIAVIGSQLPWIETLLYGLDNTVTTIRTVPALNSDRYNTHKFPEFEESSVQYDIIISDESTEHAGLGRYGDSLDPLGDIKEMRAVHKNLKPDGILIWIGSVGTDHLIWNSHRVYGTIRLPMLFKGFKDIKWIGGDREASLKRSSLNDCTSIVVLEKDTAYNV